MNRRVIGLVCLCLALFLAFRKPGIVDGIGLPDSGLNLLIIEETADRGKLSMDQKTALFGTELRRYVREHGGEFRMWDQDIDLSREQSEWFKAAMKLPHESFPWVVAGNKGRGKSFPMPAEKSTDAVLGELKVLAP